MFFRSLSFCFLLYVFRSISITGMKKKKKRKENISLHFTVAIIRSREFYRIFWLDCMRAIEMNIISFVYKNFYLSISPGIAAESLANEMFWWFWRSPRLLSFDIAPNDFQHKMFDTEMKMVKQTAHFGWESQNEEKIKSYNCI